LRSTLADILQGDKRIQVLWEEKVKKEYSHLDFTKAKCYYARVHFKLV
jgi:hypothetical protein